jgi:hypothetical protein
LCACAPSRTAATASPLSAPASAPAPSSGEHARTRCQLPAVPLRCLQLYCRCCARLHFSDLFAVLAASPRLRQALGTVCCSIAPFSPSPAPSPLCCSCRK